MQKRIKTHVHNEAGWTMVESIVTLFLLSLMAMLCVPAFAQIGERAEREVFLDLVASQLELAQTEAISREKEVQVQIQSTEQKIGIRQGNQLLREIVVPKRYHLTTDDYKENQIIFRQTGQVNGGTLELHLGKRLVGKIVIQVASGRPKVVLDP
jgi:Tfp pilus assembly protein FimT